LSSLDIPVIAEVLAICHSERSEETLESWRNVMVKFSLLFILPSVLLLSGCAGAFGSASVAIKIEAMTILTSNNCDGLDQTAGAIWINNEKELASIVSKINRLKIGGNATPAPVVDFAHDGVLLVHMGRKPTSGYGIELALMQIEIQDQIATVRVHWAEPVKGAVLAQMITHPCIMIRMTKGSYTTVRVVGQNGVVRAETRIERP
jgi:hypothetical protein